MYSMIALDGNRYGPVDLATLQQWAREGRVYLETPIKNETTGVEQPAGSLPELQAFVTQSSNAYNYYRGPQQASVPESPTSKLIPTGNPPALISYYAGIVSCFPFLGLILGPLSIWQGVTGIKRYGENPKVYGKAHAIIGIVLGSIGTLISVVLTVGLIAASMRSR